MLTNAEKGGLGVSQLQTSLTKGGGGVSQLLTITDKGGRGGPDPPKYG